jgi:gentisate 1,2-dioxygenase
MKIVIVFLILFGICFILIGIFIKKADNKQKERCTDKVMATIIRNDVVTSRTNGSRSRNYSPVFHYKYKDKEYTTSTEYSSSPPVFHEGDTTEIYVDPSNPKKIFSPEMKVAMQLSIIFSAFGIAAIIVAMVLIFVTKKYHLS